MAAYSQFFGFLYDLFLFTVVCGVFVAGWWAGRTWERIKRS